MGDRTTGAAANEYVFRFKRGHRSATGASLAPWEASERRITCGNAMRRFARRAPAAPQPQAAPDCVRWRPIRRQTIHGEGHREHRKIGCHQGRAERQRRPDHRGPGRRDDSAARARADDRTQRTHQGPGVRESGHRARRSDRQRHGERKVDIRDNGSVDGDIISPRVAIAEGRALPRQRRHAAKAAHRPSRRRPLKPASRSGRPAGSARQLRPRSRPRRRRLRLQPGRRPDTGSAPSGSQKAKAS